MATKAPTKLALAEHLVTTYYLPVDPDTDLDAVLEPTYWAHVSAKLRPGDEIIVATVDRSWRAHLLVQEAGRHSAQMAVIHKVKLTRAAAALPTTSPFKVEWRGPEAKYSVIRLTDSQVVSEGHLNEQAAHRWIASQTTALAS